MNEPLVSILMTSFNREKYIAQAIESVLSSSYKNFELIIVDDCSGDRTVEIARSFAGIDHRVRVYVNDINLGDYGNRNRAASYARGKYLKYVDADDLIYSHGLQVMVSMMEQFPDAGLGIGSLLADYHEIYPICLLPEEAYRRHYFASPILHKSPLSTIIKKSSFDNAGGFSGKRMVGDVEMWHRLAAKYPVVLLPHGLVWYRRHDEQEMADFRRDPFIPFSYSIIGLQAITSVECPLNELDKKVVLRLLKKKQLKDILLKNPFHKSTWKMIMHSFLFNKNLVFSK